MATLTRHGFSEHSWAELRSHEHARVDVTQVDSVVLRLPVNSMLLHRVSRCERHPHIGPVGKAPHQDRLAELSLNDYEMAGVHHRVSRDQREHVTHCRTEFAEVVWRWLVEIGLWDCCVFQYLQYGYENFQINALQILGVDHC